VGSVSPFMDDHHSFLQLILGLKYKRIQHIFDQIFHAFMGVKVKVSSRTTTQVLIQAAYLKIFA
jgi:hypothetical protein